MNLSFFKITFYLIIISLLTFSCDKVKNHKTENISRDRLTGKDEDTLYKREWMRIDFGNNQVEEVEIYVSESNDTISNQYKSFKNNKIDTLKSEFYDLSITNTEKPNIYKGRITIHSKYEKLKIDKHNRKSLEFNYCEQNLDSMWITTKNMENTNTINFEFENVYGRTLNGLIYQKIERDTLIKNKSSINLFRLQILVDNNPETYNLFLTSYEFDKENKFNKQKIKLIKNK